MRQTLPGDGVFLLRIEELQAVHAVHGSVSMENVY
jgi:hypothetical protein